MSLFHLLFVKYDIKQVQANSKQNFVISYTISTGLVTSIGGGMGGGAWNIVASLLFEYIWSTYTTKFCYVFANTLS